MTRTTKCLFIAYTTTSLFPAYLNSSAVYLHRTPPNTYLKHYTLPSLVNMSIPAHCITCSSVLHHIRCPYTSDTCTSPNTSAYHIGLERDLGAVFNNACWALPWESAGTLARLCVSVSSRTEGSYARVDICSDTLISTPSGAVEGAVVICILGEHRLASPGEPLSGVSVREFRDIFQGGFMGRVFSCKLKARDAIYEELSHFAVMYIYAIIVGCTKC